MQVITTPQALRFWADEQKRQHATIALVPTMGALHEGHLSLVRLAKQASGHVAVSIFVNPTQFGPGEDFENYPRTLDTDLEKLNGEDGVDVVFAPDPKTMYAQGFDTYVVPQQLAQGLCGASRPIHFRGVCTVVLLLFRMSRCDSAVFGRKDYQQLQIIKRMNQDLWLDVDIIEAPIARETDGLAISSRNVYLSAEERERAPLLQKTLQHISRKIREQPSNWRQTLDDGRRRLIEAGLRIDYLELVDAETLGPPIPATQPTTVAVAAFLGKTRLIDNVLIPTG